MLYGVRPGIGDITHLTGIPGAPSTGIITTDIIRTGTITITDITATATTIDIRIIMITIIMDIVRIPIQFTSAGKVGPIITRIQDLISENRVQLITLKDILSAAVRP